MFLGSAFLISPLKSPKRRSRCLTCWKTYSFCVIYRQFRTSWGVQTTLKLLIIQPISHLCMHCISCSWSFCSTKKIVVGCLLSCIMSCSLNCEGRGEEIASDSHPISEVTSEEWGGRRGYSGFNVATTRGNWLRFQFVQRMEKICNELIYNLLDSRENERELWGINFSLHNPVGVNRYFQLPRVF